MLEMTLDDLQQRWAWLYYQVGIENLLVTEEFNGQVRSAYIVNGLTMEFEKEYVMCMDNNDIIVQDMTILSMFLKHQLLKIFLIPYKDWYKEVLVFNDQTILIEKA